MKMRLFIASQLLSILVVAGIDRAWCQHEGHDGMAMPAREAESKENLARQKQDRLTNLQEKIEALDAELERTDLKPAKRKKIEAKLKKLLGKKNKLIDDSQTTGDEEHRGRGQHQH